MEARLRRVGLQENRGFVDDLLYVPLVVIEVVVRCAIDEKESARTGEPVANGLVVAGKSRDVGRADSEHARARAHEVGGVASVVYQDRPKREGGRPVLPARGGASRSAVVLDGNGIIEEHRLLRRNTCNTNDRQVLDLTGAVVTLERGRLCSQRVRICIGSEQLTDTLRIRESRSNCHESSHPRVDGAEPHREPAADGHPGQRRGRELPARSDRSGSWPQPGGHSVDPRCPRADVVRRRSHRTAAGRT